MDCRTPSNPHGMMRGYDVPPGMYDFNIEDNIRIVLMLILT